MDYEIIQKKTNVLDSIKLIHQISNFFGGAPYKMEKLNGKYVFYETNFNVIYSITVTSIISLIECISVFNFIGNFRSQVKQYWVTFPLTLDLLVMTTNVISSPAIFLKYRKNIYTNLNKFHGIETRLTDLAAREINAERSKHSNIFVIFVYSLCILAVSGSSISNPANKDSPLSIKLIALLTVFLILSSLSVIAVQFIAFLNIIRSMYVELNKIMKSHYRKKLNSQQIRDLRIIDNLLKDFLDDISATFSFNITVFVFQSFTNTVDATFLYLSGNGDMMVSDYIYWIVFYFNFLLSTATICTMTLGEVKT